MIVSFRDPEAATIWEGRRSRRLPPDIQAVRCESSPHQQRLTLDDLRVPPGNRLEALAKDRRGQHSIRINDQWRIGFVWRGGNAQQVEIVDYH